MYMSNKFIVSSGPKTVICAVVSKSVLYIACPRILIIRQGPHPDPHQQNINGPKTHISLLS